MQNRIVAKSFSTLCFIGISAGIVFGGGPRLKLRANPPSDRDLLGIGTPEERILNRQEQFEAVPDTLRILAIRVEFQPDSSPLTTGTGQFDLSTPDSLVLNSPPHNRTYFEHQILALNNYFASVSRGRLHLVGDVYPPEADASYMVANPMNYYSPIGDETLADQRLAELLQEGFQLADQTDDIDFSNYDSFVLFHAGVGGDIALGFDTTPQDITSAFLDFNFLKQTIGNNDAAYLGIAVNDGSYSIRDGILLPATQSQEGFDIGLLGTMTFMFGSQLGLPLLLDTDTGLSGVGVFGMMDQGSGNFSGMLPAEPGAWEKVFLGWETPIEITTGTDLEIAVSKAKSDNKIYKVPINSQEYFLVENRTRDFHGDDIAVGFDAEGNRFEFKWDTEQSVNWQPNLDKLNVITRVDEYDFGLPGSGILIWHIDETVILENIGANRVNANPDRRGVDLEEADGAQDIGIEVDFLDPASFFGIENGGVVDMFAADIKDNGFVNGDTTIISFTPYTFPNTNSNAGARSHIHFTDFSNADTLMTFTVRKGFSRAGFPHYVGNQNSDFAPLFADLDDDGFKEIIVGHGNTISVVKADGSKFLPNLDEAIVETSAGERIYPLSIFAQPVGNVLYAPAVARLNNQNIVVAATGQGVSAYRPLDGDNNGRADVLLDVSVVSAITTHPFVVESAGAFEVIVGTENGGILGIDNEGTTRAIYAGGGAIIGFAGFAADRFVYAADDGGVGLVNIDGTSLWVSEINGRPAHVPVLCDINRDDRLEIVLITDEGKVHFIDDSGAELTDGQKTNYVPTSQVAVADIDKNGFFELVYTSETSLVALNHTATLVEGFPQKTSLAEFQSGFSSSPVIADLDNDGTLDLAVGSRDEHLTVRDIDGRIPDLQLAVSGKLNSTPVVDDLDNDGELDLAIMGGDGFLYVWNTGSEGDVAWSGFLNTLTHSNAASTTPGQIVIGQDLMPKRSVYNYPNPTEGGSTTIRYSLNQPADVNIRIYDLAGDFIEEMAGAGNAPADNEVTWNLGNVASGVYFARVEARGQTSTDIAIIKIAVVK